MNDPQSSAEVHDGADAKDQRSEEQRKMDSDAEATVLGLTSAYLLNHCNAVEVLEQQTVVQLHWGDHSLIYRKRVDCSWQAVVDVDVQKGNHTTRYFDGLPATDRLQRFWAAAIRHEFNQLKARRDKRIAWASNLIKDAERYRIDLGH